MLIVSTSIIDLGSINKKISARYRIVEKYVVQG